MTNCFPNVVTGSSGSEIKPLAASEVESLKLPLLPALIWVQSVVLSSKAETCLEAWWSPHCEKSQVHPHKHRHTHTVHASILPMLHLSDEWTSAAGGFCKLMSASVGAKIKPIVSSHPRPAWFCVLGSFQQTRLFCSQSTPQFAWPQNNKCYIFGRFPPFG